MKKELIITLVIVISFILLLSFATKKEDNKDGITYLSMSEYNKMISNKDDFVLIISQDGCSHCEEFLPIASKVSLENKITIYDINLTKLNSADKSKIASLYNIKATPTTIFIKNGKEENSTARILSSTTEDMLIEKLKEQGFIK